MFIGLFILACQGPQNNPESTTTEAEEIPEAMAEAESVAADPTADTISLNTFNTWTQNWERNAATWIGSNSLKGFNLPLIDLENVLGESPDSSRFYLGLESDGSGGFNAKLMIVGVKAGVDMIDYAKGQYVYDVSSACPPFCGGN